MPPFDNLLTLLGSRSFTSIWFWLALVAAWSVAGRTIIGVPTEVLGRARRAKGQGDAAVVLLDWLSLILPRWRLSSKEGAVFLGVTSFGMTVLAALGFGYRLEMAQALTLFLLPFWVLFWMRLSLARRLTPLVKVASSQDGALDEAVIKVIRSMVWHKRWVTVLSIVSVTLTTIWGALWSLLHPFAF